MENVYKENKIETGQWNILEAEASRGEWSEGEAGCLSDNYSENTGVSSDQARRLSIRNSSCHRYKSLQSFHRPAKYGN